MSFPHDSSSSAIPTSPLSAVEKAKEQQEEVRQKHYVWKRNVFVARAPPPPIGRLHRFNPRSERKYSGAHTQFSVAQVLLRSEKEMENVSQQNETRATNVSEMTTTSPLPNSSSSSSFSVSSLRAEQWRQKMKEEMSRRLPFADLAIRSDPKRTILVANLPPNAVNEEVRQFLERFGRVTHVRVIMEKSSRKQERKNLTLPFQEEEKSVNKENNKEVYRPPRSRRYGFASFALVAEAKKAVAHSRRYRLKGHIIVIDWERGRELNFLPKRLATATAIIEKEERSNGTEGHDDSHKENSHCSAFLSTTISSVGMKRAFGTGVPEDGGDEDEEKSKKMKGEPMSEMEAEELAARNKKVDHSPPRVASLALLPVDTEDDQDFLDAILSHL